MLLDPEDLFLITSEITIVFSLFLATILAVRIGKRHPGLAQEGWSIIILGLIFMTTHAIFDAFDTLQLGDLIVDILNVLDGLTFVIGIALFGYGIYRIAVFSKKKWE